VNRGHVAEVRPLANGRQLIVLSSGARLVSSRRMSGKLKEDMTRPS
jgi:DNA-binding LytR/AlgR family response regulator